MRPWTVLVAVAAVVVTASASVLSAGLLTAGPACACSCVMLAPESLVQQADAVAVGTATAVDDVDQGREITFRVDRGYIRELPREVTVSTGSSSASCGVSVRVGEPALLVLRDGPDGWSSTSCSSLGVTEDIVARVAGPALEPVGASAGPGGGQDSAGSASTALGWAFGSLAVVVVAGVGVLWWVSRWRSRDGRPGTRGPAG